MATKPYSKRVSDAQVMVAGLKNNVEKTARRGLDTIAIDKFETIRLDAARLNDEQEKLKADLKLKTAELEAKMSELDLQMSEASKIVKMDFPQQQWVEFGIVAKR